MIHLFVHVLWIKEVGLVILKPNSFMWFPSDIVFLN